MDDFQIGKADPFDDCVRRLIQRHLEFGRATTPPEDAHALEVDELLDPAIVLFAARTGIEVLAIGALKEIGDDHGEIKAMHTAGRARGRGIGGAMLEHLLTEARNRGYRRVSLETGSMEAFAPARSLYGRAGFSVCAPFGEYRESPNSIYMALDF
jgi:putative acetyltransferase